MKERFHNLYSVLIALLITALPASANDNFSLKSYGTSTEGDVVLVSAEFDFTLPERVEDALNEGVDLIFAVHVNVSVPDEWKPDRQLINFDIRKRLGYHALTKKYTVDDLTFGNRDSFHSLDAALAEVGRVSKVNLIDTSVARSHEDAVVKLQVDLLQSELPLLLKLQAIILPEWYLGSPWFAWKIRR